jgi:hypothetical protein
MSRSPNVTSLVAGLVVTALGALVVMNADGRLDLDFAYMGPALVAALGAVLLASGLAARGRRPS